MTHPGSQRVPPIGTQVSALAAQAPDAPAVTCSGVTITRAELDATSNRLARAFASLGVGVGDYVTIVLHNSLDWVYAVLACWKLGAVPQPLSARLPDTELAALLELRPPALLVGRADPTGDTPSASAAVAEIAAEFSDDPLPEAVSPVWKSMASGGSTGRPKLIEAGNDSRVPPTIGAPLGAQPGDVNLVSVPLSHNTGFTTFAIGLLQGHHLVLMPRFEPQEFLRLATEYRVTFLATVSGDAPLVELVSILCTLLLFFNSGFVPVQAYPTWLQPVVAAQPMSCAVDAMKALALGGPTLTPVLQTLAWSLGMVLVFLYPAIKGYRRASSTA